MRRLILLAALSGSLSQLGHTQVQERNLQTVPVHGGSVPGLLAYEEHGSADGEPVVLIHGGYIADAFLPIAQQPSLSDFRVLLIHSRGMGESSIVEAPFGYPERAEDIVHFLQALEIERAHLVGHSAGAELALKVALSAPDRVQSLVLAEPGFTRHVGELLTTPEEREQRRQERLSRSAENRRADEAEGIEQRRAAVDRFLTNCLGDKDRLDVIPGAYEQVLTNGRDAFLLMGETNRLTPPEDPFNPPVHLPRIPQPILFLTGEREDYRAYANLVSQYHENTEIVSFDAPHCFTILHPREVAETLADFFARNPM